MVLRRTICMCIRCSRIASKSSLSKLVMQIELSRSFDAVHKPISMCIFLLRLSAVKASNTSMLSWCCLSFWFPFATCDGIENAVSESAMHTNGFEKQSCFVFCELVEKIISHAHDGYCSMFLFLWPCVIIRLGTRCKLACSNSITAQSMHNAKHGNITTQTKYHKTKALLDNK